eukprot:CAMPEP_0202978400 /NCGR_PEP_ID=MMETSP1396-20130829/84835_1 /ASSEMBLY_ACC=CAM_ASM_000872 /TAXON_ID= /ORGANISM="Pseudokeronopsis sp., Strain Brazil" /LENGTH=85 /DNA_ID=CAMNT_0049717355 /DNA_START=488 /DNA_END=745 /DNA_ORIENTATION=-
MDLIGEMSDLLVQIVLICIFNDEEAYQESLDYTLGGQTEKLTLGAFLNKSFAELFIRARKLPIMIIPELLPHYITKYDKEVQANC